MEALFERFVINMTKTQAESASHSGACDMDVTALLESPNIRRQLKKISADAIRAELEEYGAWDAEELADDAQNQKRIVWLAAGNITGNIKEKR